MLLSLRFILRHTVLRYIIVVVSQLYYGPVVTNCIVYHYTKRATLARLLANEGLAIYVVF